MLPNVAFRMKLRRLLHALHPRNFRQHLGQKPCLLQQPKRSLRTAFLARRLRRLSPAERQALAEVVSLLERLVAEA